MLRSALPPPHHLVDLFCSRSWVLFSFGSSRFFRVRNMSCLLIYFQVGCVFIFFARWSPLLVNWVGDLPVCVMFRAVFEFESHPRIYFNVSILSECLDVLFTMAQLIFYC